MKINVLEQHGTRTEQRERIIPAVYDGEGNILTEERTETYTVEVPVMVSVTRDMTPEEEAEMLANQPIDQRTYEQMVEDFIRERYTVSDELAILRQRDTKPEEFEAYNAFCEECKARAKTQANAPTIEK